MNKNITQKDLKQFGITFGIILFVIGGIHFLKNNTNIYPWIFGFAVFFALIGLLKPELLKGFLESVAREFGIETKTIFTDGSQPVGRGIGPALEARDVLAVLTEAFPIGK